MGEIRVSQVTLEDVVSNLLRIDCTFWACKGPDAPYEDMVTCTLCQSIQALRRLITTETPPGDMTFGEYWAEVEALAKSITEDVLSDLDENTRAEVIEAGDFDASDDAREMLSERLWERIDSHQWVMYTAYNFDVLRHSPNDDYTVTNWGADGIASESGMNWAALAFGALYADVLEHSAFGKVPSSDEF